jgi:hypothetical protein
MLTGWKCGLLSAQGLFLLLVSEGLVHIFFIADEAME